MRRPLSLLHPPGLCAMMTHVGGEKNRCNPCKNACGPSAAKTDGAAAFCCNCRRAMPEGIQYSVFSNCSSTVTVSPSGPRKLFKGVTTAMSGVLARFPLLLPVRNSFASYGASAVTRTSDRGHVAEAINQYRSGGVSIRVSKETFLPLNVQPVFSF